MNTKSTELSREQIKKLTLAPDKPIHQGILPPGELDLESAKTERSIGSRAIPKILFITLMISPVFLIVFLFLHSSQFFSVKADALPQQERSQEREVDKLRKKLDDANGTIATFKRDRAKAPLEPTQTKLPPAPPPPSSHSLPPSPEPAASVPPPVRITSPEAPSPVKISSPHHVFKEIPKLVGGHVFGSGALPEEEANGNGVAGGTGNQSLVIAQKSSVKSQEIMTDLAPDSSLEAPLLNEQPQQLLEVGTKAKAILVTPFVRDLRSLEQFYPNLTVSLISPLGEIKAGTNITVEARLVPGSELIEFVATTLVKEENGRYQEIPLANSVVLRNQDSSPIIPPTLKEDEVASQDLGERIFFEAARNVLGGGNVLEKGANTILNELQKRNQSAIRGIGSKSNIQFLKAGTEVEVFVRQSLVLPASLFE